MPDKSAKPIAIVPEKLRPYIFHGLRLKYPVENQQAAVESCPFCDGQKMRISLATGKYQCFNCQTGNEKGGGNIYTFIEQLWWLSFEATANSPNIYKELHEDRRLIVPETLASWGVTKSLVTDEWVIPAYNESGKLSQLYKYIPVDGKMRLLPTPTLGHGLFGRVASVADAETVFIDEGCWDGMAFEEVGTQCRKAGGKMIPTRNPRASFLGSQKACVIAVPGCTTFLDHWLPMFADKRVVFLYDSDHPQQNQQSGIELVPAGYRGVVRAAKLLLGCKMPPKSIDYLNWGPKGYSEELPHGFDVRDWLTKGPENELTGSGTPLVSRIGHFQALLGKITAFSGSAVKTQARGLKRDVKGGKVGKLGSGEGKAETNGHVTPKEIPATVEKKLLECIPCESYAELVTAWRKAMKWIDGLDHALASMLASVISTMVVGDQLWLKIIGPASCGKSTLCEALAVNKEYTFSKSTIRGFHSGYKEGAGTDQDNSLVVLVNGKTLITKDGDTLLQSPNLGQILSEARDIYDRTSRTHYRNKMGKDYEGISMTWLLCGTSSLRSIDNSELGERFLDCVIMEGIPEDLEDEIGMRVAFKTFRNRSLEVGADGTNQNDPNLQIAMGLTGGYVSYLRENATALLDQVNASDETLLRCAKLGKFVSHMRARPSMHQEETSERELSARITSQLVRYGMCAAAVTNKRTMDSDVMRRTTKIAFDTARGQTFEIAKHLHENPEGLEAKTVQLLAGQYEGKTRELLRFLRAIHIAENFIYVNENGVKGKIRYRLTHRMRNLWDVVHEGLPTSVTE